MFEKRKTSCKTCKRWTSAPPCHHCWDDVDVDKATAHWVGGREILHTTMLAMINDDDHGDDSNFDEGNSDDTEDIEIMMVMIDGGDDDDDLLIYIFFSSSIS